MSLRQRLGRIGRWPRLIAAAACLLLAAVSALESRAVRPRSTPGAPMIVVAARTLAAGHVLGPRDLTMARTSNPGAVTEPRALAGRTLSGPLARGEPVTALRLVDAALTTGLRTGTVAMPIELSADVRGLVSPGGRVDLLATAAAGDTAPPTANAPSAQRVVERALVLAVLPPDSSSGAGGCRLILALDRDAALRIAGARSTRVFQVAALPP